MSQSVDLTNNATVTLTLQQWNTILTGLHELAGSVRWPLIYAINAQLAPQIQHAAPEPANHEVL